MARQFEYFWVEFMLSWLPEVVKNFYTDPTIQKTYNFQSILDENTLWVRYTREECAKTYEFRVFDFEWINLPYALHQEWDATRPQRGNYIIIGSHKVCEEAIPVGGLIYIGQKLWRFNSVEGHTNMYCISPQ